MASKEALERASEIEGTGGYSAMTVMQVWESLGPSCKMRYNKMKPNDDVAWMITELVRRLSRHIDSLETKEKPNAKAGNKHRRSRKSPE